MSHWRTLKKIDQLGLGFDEKVKEWKETQINHTQICTVVDAIQDIFDVTPSTTTPSLAPLEPLEPWVATPVQTVITAATTVSPVHTFDGTSLKERVNTMVGGKFNDEVFAMVVKHTKENTRKADIIEKLSKGPSSYQLTGDNLDLLIKVKHMSSTNQNNSIHWFNLNGVLNRIQGTHLSDKVPIKSILDVENSDFLPSYQDNLDFLCDMIPLVTRVAVTKIPALQEFRNIVVWHIPHQYSKEMSMKSQQV